MCDNLFLTVGRIPTVRGKRQQGRYVYKDVHRRRQRTCLLPSIAAMPHLIENSLFVHQILSHLVTLSQRPVEDISAYLGASRLLREVADTDIADIVWERAHMRQFGSLPSSLREITINMGMTWRALCQRRVAKVQCVEAKIGGDILTKYEPSSSIRCA